MVRGGEETLGPKQASKRVQRNGAPKKDKAGACWLRQEGLWCLGLAHQTGDM